MTLGVILPNEAGDSGAVVGLVARCEIAPNLYAKLPQSPFAAAMGRLLPFG